MNAWSTFLLSLCKCISELHTNISAREESEVVCICLRSQEEYKLDLTNDATYYLTVQPSLCNISVYRFIK